MVSPLCLVCMWQHVKLSDDSLGSRLRYSLVVNEDVKKAKKKGPKGRQNGKSLHSQGIIMYYVFAF